MLGNRNHYRGYSWDDLAFYGLDFPHLTLGWTEQSWDGIKEAPASTTKSWKELSQEERSVASELCYFRDNWDGLDMTPNNGPFLFPKVKQRYVEWRALPGDVRRAARDSLLYTKETWNNLGTADIETRSWKELTEHQRSDVIHMGFYRRTWDCFHNHYRSYEWDELDRDSRDSLQVLGWSETRWKNSDTPPSYNNEWDRLSETEQSVASVLCFFEDNWNKNNLEAVGEVMTEDDVEDSTVGVDEETLDPGQDVDKVSEILNPADLANSAGMIGTRRGICVSSVLFGTLIQLLPFQL